MTKGKHLGYLISKEGIVIDPKIDKYIIAISYPNNKKSKKSFLGKIYFVCRFIFGFAETIKPLQKMIKLIL